MGPFRHATIKRKLILISMVTTGVALLVSGAILTVNEMISFRRSLENSLAVQAQIVGNNCTAALTFSNAAVAREILGALKAVPPGLTNPSGPSDGAAAKAIPSSKAVTILKYLDKGGAQENNLHSS